MNSNFMDIEEDQQLNQSVNGFLTPYSHFIIGKSNKQKKAHTRSYMKNCPFHLILFYLVKIKFYE